MKYDNDLRRFRIGSMIFAAVNLATAAACVRYRQWVAAFAAVIWAANCFYMPNYWRSVQRTRDEVTADIAKWRAEWKTMLAESSREGAALLAEALEAAGRAAPMAKPKDWKHWLN
jgi:hypothetical protein